MPRFFIDGPVEDTAFVRGEDADHISKSLRMKIGDSVTLSDGGGTDYDCKINDIQKGEIALEVIASRENTAEPPVKITLYQAFAKSDKLEFVVQKAVELGVHSIVPTLTARCVSRPDQKSMSKKTERMQKIALEAAKQSMRGRVPRVLPPVDFAGAIADAAGHDTAILFYENSARPLGSIIAGSHSDSIAIIIGPEGGFEPEEVAAAERAGVCTASLGRRILRCETAPLAALAAIIYEYENRH